MSASDSEDDLSDEALIPRDADGAVVIEDPPNPRLHLTPDATEISAIRMLDAAAKARKER